MVEAPLFLDGFFTSEYRVVNTSPPKKNYSYPYIQEYPETL